MSNNVPYAIYNLTGKNISGIISPIHFYPGDTEDEKYKPLFYPTEPNITPNRYFISNKGNIWDSFRNDFVSINYPVRNYEMAGNRKDYPRAAIEIQNGYGKSVSYKQLQVHRMVMTSHQYIEGCDKIEVNHKDLDKYNFSLDNLEWTDRIDNLDHAVKNNTWDKKYKIDITADELFIVCEKLQAGQSVENISDEMKISLETIGAIASKEKYSSVSDYYDLPAYTNQYKKQKKIADKLTDEQVHEICKLLQDGLGYTKVADQLNIPLHIVRDIRYKENYYADIKSQYTFPQTSITRVLTSGDVRKICEMLQAGKAYKEITSKLHVSDATIKAIKSGKIYPEISKLYNIEPPKVYAKSLRDDQVHKICRMVSQNKYNDREIAKIIDCNWTQVRDIRLRTRYSDISKRYSW